MKTSIVCFALANVCLTAGCGQQLVQFGEADLAVNVNLDMGRGDSAEPSDLVMTPDFQLPDLQMPDLVLLNTGPLGVLESYAVVANTTITNHGPTTIIGSIALSPGLVISGVPHDMPIDGTIHLDDADADKAQTDLTTAYKEMVAKVCGTNLTGMDLGDTTLAPGVYCFNGDAAMAVGTTLILDAKGDPNASWTFQVSGAMVFNAFATVDVINGARDCSVYWQVGSSVILGDSARVAGSLLAQSNITLTENAKVGRALSRAGAVSMDTDVIAIGFCH